MQITEEGLVHYFEVVMPHMNELQRRVVVGATAELLGRGGKSVVAVASGLSRTTVTKAESEVAEGIEPPYSFMLIMDVTSGDEIKPSSPSMPLSSSFDVSGNAEQDDRSESQFAPMTSFFSQPHRAADCKGKQERVGA